MSIDEIIAGMTDAQKRALLAFSAAADEYPGHYAKAKELGVTGGTLRSLYGLGGVNPKTLELGPILVVDDFTREGTFWQIQPLGLAVRARLKEQDNA